MKKMRTQRTEICDKVKPLSESKKQKNSIILKTKLINVKISDTKKSIKSILDRNSDPITGFKETAKGHVIIECKNKEDCEVVKAKLNEKISNDYSISDIKENFWPKIAIVGVENYESEDKFIAALIEENATITSESKIKVIKVFGAEKPKKTYNN